MKKFTPDEWAVRMLIRSQSPDYTCEVTPGVGG